ncbi:hypothetical protein ABC766_27360 [Methylobacterium fujisawaense]|uniref:hypothetical protein n=1 Tax=Methylobacterium fujisawaense TaxID=107400 RepID=UPI0031F5A8A1
MSDEQKAYLQALVDVRSWHRWQIGQAVGDVRTIQAHEMAIAWIEEVIAAKRRHAVEDEAERQRVRAANSQIGGPHT